MKNVCLLLIMAILLFSCSCKLNKEASTISVEESVMEPIEIESIEDGGEGGDEEVVEAEEIVILRGGSAKTDRPGRLQVGDVIKSVEVESNSEVESSPLEDNIVNLIDTSQVIDPNFGIIAYNIPNVFTVNEYSTIRLRISKENEIESVVIGNRNIPIVGLDSDDKVILESIEIDDVISAKLYSDSGVEIMLLNNEEQRLSERGYVEWVWRVKPLKAENCYVKMTITLSGKDLVVYEKEISVNPDWGWSFSNWVSNWWEAITATIITPILIPFLIWFYRRRNKKKN